jgi:phage gp29-like protein
MSQLTQVLAEGPHEAWWAPLHHAASTSSLLQSEAASGRFQRSIHELFNEMEEKDGHLYAVLQTRLNGVLGLDRAVHASGNGAAERAAADLASTVLERLPRRELFLRRLLDGLAKGFSVVQLVWDYEPGTGRLVPVDWREHLQESVLFDAAGGLLLQAPPFRPPSGSVPDGGAFPAPPRKFITLVFGGDARNPHGRGLLQRAYWFYWFKKNCLRWWSIYNEKYGAPTAIGTFAPHTGEDDRAHLLDALRALQTDIGIVVPEGISIQLLESRGRGDGSTYRELADWCNDEISKIVLGATLTSGEGRRSGSLALGSVHEAIRQDYREADARLLEDVLNGTLLRWITELNFPRGTRPPHLAFDTRPAEDLEAQARIDRELVALGVPLPLRYFHERYRRPEPAPGERALRFDDSNLYQYHIRYGVLTVNEVRARLHLPPVAWGDERIAPDGSAAPAATTTRGAREDRTARTRENDGEGRRETEPREP